MIPNFVNFYLNLCNITMISQQLSPFIHVDPMPIDIHGPLDID